MAEGIAFENGRISKFQELMTLTLTVDRVILHTVRRQSLTSTNIPNLIEIGKILESQLSFLPSSKSRDTKTRTNIKNLALSNFDNVP